MIGREWLVALIRRHPAVAYFVMTFVVSWSAALCVAFPWLRQGESLPDLAGILMFPAMLLGPSVTGIVLIYVVDGSVGLRALGQRLRRWRLGSWYAVLLIPPVLVYGVLKCLRYFVSPAFTPNLFWAGVSFGIPAGYLEEIGWMGFAFEKLREGRTAFGAAVLLGLAWAAWHLPVVDFLGAAHPHGPYWLPFFLAFTVAMTAVRVLISWVTVHTSSILAAQLLHMSSTGALVVFGATRLGPRQEAQWYGLYGLALWLIVALLVLNAGANLRRPPSRSTLARGLSGGDPRG